MDAELKAKWIAALESGEYAKTTGALNTTEPWTSRGEIHPVGFCCLGVLADISGEGGWVPSLIEGRREFMDKKTNRSDCGLLPGPTAKRLGLWGKKATRS